MEKGFAEWKNDEVMEENKLSKMDLAACFYYGI